MPHTEYMTNTCCYRTIGHYPYCTPADRDAATARAVEALRAKLTTPSSHQEGYGDVTFVRTDGATVTIPDLRIDGIGVDFDQAKLGVVSATDINEQIFHVPFVSHWTVEYR